MNYSPWGCKKSDITEQLTHTHTHTHTHTDTRDDSEVLMLCEICLTLVAAFILPIFTELNVYNWYPMFTLSLYIGSRQKLYLTSPKFSVPFLCVTTKCIALKT